ncbi:MAG: hypothetical protein NC228_10635, partial [[Eubacterium] siraeum]|nr:hypothetical protein [[Eubacterium] siraeum]
DLYSFQSGSFSQKTLISRDTKVENQEYFQLKKGQTLENGLTVADAYMKLSVTEKPDEKGYEIEDTTVVLKGEISLSGVLYCKKKDINSAADYDEVLFYPDPEYSELIPCPYFGNELTVFGLADSKRDFAFVTSAFPFKLGSAGSLGIDLKPYFSEADCLKANVTVSNISVRYFQNTPACFGVLERVEILS